MATTLDIEQAPGHAAHEVGGTGAERGDAHLACG